MSDQVQLIRMRRDEPPFTADVHPLEEASYADFGWRRDESEARAREEAAKAEAERAKAEAEAAASVEAEAKAGPESEPKDEGEGVELKLEEMKRPQLVVEAEKYGVKLNPGMSNIQAVAAIKDAMVKRAAEFLASQEQPQQ